MQVQNINKLVKGKKTRIGESCNKYEDQKEYQDGQTLPSKRKE